MVQSLELFEGPLVHIFKNQSLDGKKWCIVPLRLWCEVFYSIRLYKSYYNVLFIFIACVLPSCSLLFLLVQVIFMEHIQILITSKLITFQDVEVCWCGIIAIIFKQNYKLSTWLIQTIIFFLNVERCHIIITTTRDLLKYALKNAGLF